MKNRFLTLVLSVSAIILQSCDPLSSIRVETMVPADIEFPGKFNKAVFVNLANDLNNDGDIDTLLYDIITKEMSLGFLDAIQVSAGIDSTRFLYVKGFPEKKQLYKLDTISWRYLEKLSARSNADIFIVLDSLKLTMNSEVTKDYYSTPVEYYQYRDLAINAYWSVYDLVMKRRLDKFHYGDTFSWDARAYAETELEKKMPSIEKSIREASYFAAIDYANRIFPGWRTETRYYFDLGNKDFEKAAMYVKDYQWEDAIKIWEEYAGDVDKEIASRACFNLAFGNEMIGELDLAIAWAKQSKSIKNKTRTRYYIAMLESRKQSLKKLKKQIY